MINDDAQGVVNCCSFTHSQNNDEQKLAYKVHQIYPESRIAYTQSTAIVSEFAINIALENLGYKVDYTRNVNTNGVDIEVDSNTAIEVWNFSKAHSYRDKIDSVKDNLKGYKYKFLVTSFISNEVKAELAQDNITAIVTGFQILVNDELYLSYYANEEGKKYLCPKTIIELSNLLKSYLPKKDEPYTIEDNKPKATEIGYVYVPNTNSSKVSIIDNVIEVFLGTINRIAGFRAKLHDKPIKEPKVMAVFGIPVPNDRLLELWNTLEPVRSMPTVYARVLDREEFNQFIQEGYIDTGFNANNLRWEYDIESACPDDYVAIVQKGEPNTNTYYIIATEDPRRSLDESLLHELKHIYNRDLEKHMRCK